MIQFGKLVRDKIPAIIEARGERAVWHVASEEEYHRLLREKLGEEVRELLEAMNIEECADVCEVIEAIATQSGKTFADVLRAKAEKTEKRGGFTGRIVLDEAEERRG
jgi:predicted house-cleaning noncanonical NTP pyrophosphatase (MazG superfamily)